MSILVSEPSAFQPVSPALHRTAQYTALIFLAFAGFVAENSAIFAAFVRVFANLFAATFGPFALALAVLHLGMLVLALGLLMLVFAMVMGYNKRHKHYLDLLVKTY
ncbi:MAG: hypothetical protein LBF25_00625, partial [Puniceicoccales bacterium]|jgi:uncharacterized membrane protein|nr:hypothetical protein [Puniceicoccales bacterium]